MFEKFSIRLILVVFFITSVGPRSDAFAQVMPELPAPGTMVDFSPKFNQATLKGIVFHPENPFKFDFVMDEGDVHLNQAEAREQSKRIATYFLASLTTPEKEIWVNLSPFEKERIVPVSFGNTVMGQNLLAQDYMLKQIMATALYPERGLGKEFWQEVYQRALVEFGTTNISFNTFNKVWIVPDKAVVYENPKMNAVFVAQSSLKVLMEKDYLAAKKSQGQPGDMALAVSPSTLPSEAGLNVKAPQGNHLIDLEVADTMSAAVIKELVIPALEHEVNEGKNFAPLRQVYNSLILAKWYKNNLCDNIIAKGYINRNKIKGVDSHDKQLVSKIYRQYLKAYKKGVFNYIKEDFDESTQSMVPRKYFSGGIFGANWNVVKTTSPAMVAGIFKRRAVLVSVLLSVVVNAVAPAAFGQQVSGQPTSLTVPGGQMLPSATGLINSNVQIIVDAIKSESNMEKAAALLEVTPFDQKIADAIAWDARESGRFDGSKLLQSLNLTATYPPGGQVGMEGILDLPHQIGNFVNEQLNKGNPSFVVAEMNWVERNADHFQDPTFWQRLFKKDIFNSVSGGIPFDSVPAKIARMRALAALLKSGVAPSVVLGRAVPLDPVYESLKSTDHNEQIAALGFLAYVPDKDNRFREKLDEFIDHPPTNDVVALEMAARIANQKQMPASVQNILQDAHALFQDMPPGTVESTNWHKPFSGIIDQVIELSGSDKGKLLRNLDALANSWTKSARPDSFNSIYLRTIAQAYRKGMLTQTEANDLVNAAKIRYGMLPNKISLPIKPAQPGVDVANLVDQLRNNTKNDPGTVRTIIEQGDYEFLPPLKQILTETGNPEVARSIVANLNLIYALDVGNMPGWVEAINQKSRSNPEWGIVISKSLSTAGISTDSFVMDTIPRGITLSNLMTRDGISSFQTWASTWAEMAAKSNISDDTLRLMLSASPGDGIIKNALLGAVANARNGKIGPGSVPLPGYLFAGSMIEEHLNSGKYSRQQVANSLYQAYREITDHSNGLSGAAIVQNLVGRYKDNPEAKLELAEIFNLIPDIGYEWLSSLWGGYGPSDIHFAQVDIKILDLFVGKIQAEDKRIKQIKDPRVAEKASKAFNLQLKSPTSRFVITWKYWRENREITSSGKLSMDELMENGLVNLGENIIGDAVVGIYPSLNPDEVQTILARFPNLKPRIDKTYPLSAYASALSRVLDPTNAKQTRRVILAEMKNLPTFPATALRDLREASSSIIFEDSDLRNDLNSVMAAAERYLTLQGRITATDNNELSHYSLETFKHAQSVEKRVLALKLFVNAPALTAGNLFWDASVYLGDEFFKFIQEQQKNDPDSFNVQKSNDFFDVLGTMSDLISQLKDKDPEKYQELVDVIRADLGNQRLADIYDNPMPYMLAASLGALPDNFDLGLEDAPDDHLIRFSGGTAQSTVTENKKDIVSILRNLADDLANSFQQTTAVKSNNDILLDFRQAFDPFHPVAQEAGIMALKKAAFLVQNKIPIRSPKVRTVILYHDFQYAPKVDPVRGVSITIPQMLPKEDMLTSEEDWVVYEDVSIKMKQRSLDRELHDNDLFIHHPAAGAELVSGIMTSILNGRSDMVKSVLQFDYDRGAYGYGIGNTTIEDDYTGQVIDDGFFRVSQLPQQKNDVKRSVKSEMDSFIKNFPPYWSAKVHFVPHIKGLMDQIQVPDKAMFSATNGGIDLRGFSLQSNHSAGIRTAFNEPALLAVLMKANGLVPIIEEVQTLSQTMVNHLLGIL